MNTTSQHPDFPMTIPVDSEHIGVRLLIPLLAFGGIAAGILLSGVVQALLGELVSVWCVAMGLSIVFAIVLTQIGELVIKPRWPSRRYLVLDEDGLILRHRKAAQHHLDFQFRWADKPTVHCWYWEVETRKTRVRRGWYCVVVRLSVMEKYVTVYTFMPQADLEALPRYNDWFIRLLPKAVREKMTATDPRGAAVQSRYKKLESERWLDGAEVVAKDFIVILNVISELGDLQH